MVLPYEEPLTPRTPADRVIPEPPRRGEAGRRALRHLRRRVDAAGLVDDLWTLHPPVGGSLPGRSGWPVGATSTRSRISRRPPRRTSASWPPGSSAPS